MLADTYSIWKRNDIYLSYNAPLNDWVITKENIYGYSTYQLWFYVRSPGIAPILYPETYSLAHTILFYGP